MKEIANSSARTVALVLGALLAVLGMPESIKIAGNEIQISNPWFRAALIVGGTALAILAIFFGGVFDDRKQPLATGAGPSHPARSGIPVGLYKWDESKTLTFASLLGKANRVSISGRTAVNILSRNDAEIRAYLKRGGQLRVLVLDPDRAAAFDIYTEPTADLVENLRRGMKYATALQAEFPGRVELRLTSRPPTLGIVWTEGSDASPVIPGETGVMQLKLYLDHSATGAGRPNVLVTSSQPWYHVLTEDFDAAWTTSSVVNMNKEAL